MEGYWLLGAVLALAALQVAAVLYARRARRGGDERTASGDVECPGCGAVNGTDYRYCRRCVSELPGGTRLRPGSDPPRSRRTL